jgi:hypothetical protein
LFFLKKIKILFLGGAFMGYYSNFTFNTENAVVDVKKIKELEAFFSNPENHEDISGFLNVSIGVDTNSANAEFGRMNDIIVEDAYAKFYDDRLLADKLSTALISGYVELHFVGEDGVAWGYLVTPNKVRDMITQWVVLDDIQS